MSFDTTNAPPAAPVDTSTTEGQAPAADTTPPAPTKPNPEDVFASKFSALSKKEKDVRQKEAALKDRLSKLEKYEQDSTTWKENPAAVLKFLEAEYGIDFAKLADHQIQSFQDSLPKSPEEQLEARIKAMEDKAKQEEEARVKQAEKDELEKAEKYTKLLNTEISKIVDGDAEAFELIKAFNQHEAVIDTMKANYEETGELLDITTACQWVESYLEQQLAQTPKAAKLRKLFTQDETQQVEDNKPTDEPSTLSVDQMSSSSKPAPKTQTADPLDRDARIRAILARNNGN